MPRTPPPLCRNGRGPWNSSAGSGQNIYSISPLERYCPLRNILFVQFEKSIQSGKNTFHIDKVSPALDAAPPMVFAKIFFKKFVDMAGQKNVDRWIQELLGRISIV